MKERLIRIDGLVKRYRFVLAAVLALALFMAIGTSVFAYNLLTMRTPGWDKADRMTYASATTVTVKGDRIWRYNSGSKIRFVQDGGLEYYNVVAEPTFSSATGLTTLTLDGYGAYTVANTLITSQFHSVHWAPHDFPFTTIGNFSTGAIRGLEQAEPVAPAANYYVIYAKDVAGKTNLCARFATGIVTCFAAEP